MGIELSTFIPFLSIFLLVWLIIIIFFRLWKKYSNQKTITSKQPPGPPKLPVIGNLHQLLSSLPHRRITNLANTYGPLMHLQLGQISTLVVSSPQVAKQFLSDFDINFSERGRETVADIVLYNRQSISFAPYGDFWRQLRKIAALTLLSSKRVQMFRPVREEEVSNFVASIRSKVGSPINVSDAIVSLMNSIAFRSILGRKNKNPEQILPVIRGVLSAVAGFSVVDVFPSLEFIHIITCMKYRLLKIRNEADAMLEKIISEHRVELMGGQGESSNLLDVLLELQGDSEARLTTDCIKAIIIEFITAGTDTAATVLEWAISELMKNPSAMRKSQEEVRSVYFRCGKLDETVLHELKFLKAVVKEVMRLHPPVPLIPKQCKEGCNINGYNINAKTDVLINVWAIGRDPSYWIEPEKFYPERFLEREIDYNGFSFGFIPFGAGRRICPGLLMGIANIELPLASLLCHFNWELPDEMKPQDLNMTEDFSIIVRRKNDLYLIPTAYQ